jgi:hypothetical protein
VATESLSFDITAHDLASRNFREVGRAALDASAKIDVAAASVKLWDATTVKSGKAAATSETAMRTHAKAAALLADAEAVLSGRATVTTKLMADQGRELDDGTTRMSKFGRATSGASSLLGGFGSSAGGAGGAMAGLAAAGVALAPVLVTLGAGFGGLGLAAYGLSKNQALMSKTLAPLKAEYAGFQRELQPVLLQDFGAAAQLAGHVLHDLEPVSKATGAALGGLLNRVDAEFASGKWQAFFSWMGTQAGPDIKLVGNLVVDLTKDLPSLLESLQPVARGFLVLADDVLKAAGAYTEFIRTEEHKGQQQGSFGKQISDFLKYGYGTSYKNQVLAAAAAQAELDKRLRDAHTATADLISPLGTVNSGFISGKTAAQNQANAVSNLVGALNALNSGLLTTEADQVAWKQAQQAATAAIKGNTGSLDSNRASALAARSAIISSTQAALSFANQQATTGHDVSGASQTIRDQINWLKQHAGKSKIARDEIAALELQLSKLKPNYGANVNVHGSGSGSIVLSASGVAAKIQSILAFKAAGGMVTGGTPGKDSVLGALMPGEVIVPTPMVRAGAVDHLRGKLPGFAAGGLVGTGAEFTAAPPWAAGVAGRWGEAALGPAISAVVGAVKQALAAAGRAAAAAVGGSGGPSSGSVGALERYALSLFPSHGWGPGQIGSLIALWMGESGWNARARNPSSGAFGIPQALPASKMGALAASGNAAAQIRWGENYIAQVYGNPMRAYSMWLSRSPHWYDQGGWLPTGVSLAVNTTGRPEQVIPSGGRGGGGNTYVLENRGVIGSQMELQNWLVRSLDTLGRQGRLPQPDRGWTGRRR